MVSILLLLTQLTCARLRSTTQQTPAPSSEQKSLVNQILDRYIEAVGGKEAIDRINSYKMKGTFEIPTLGVQGQLESWGKVPNKTLTILDFPRIGTVRKGFDGTTRWVKTPAGTFKDSGPQEIAELDKDAEVYRAGSIRSLYESMKVESKARLNGRDVYVVEGSPAKGPAEKLFFDVENGLLLRWDMARKQPGRGTVFVKVHLDDYKDTDGVKVPFNVRFAFESFNLTVKLNELQHNIPIDDAVFAEPK